MMADSSEQFCDAIRAAGLSPPNIIERGRFHRFPGDGKRNGNTAGWCKLFDDGCAGVFGDFSTGVVESWQAERPRPQTPAELEAFRRKVEESKAQAEAKRQAEHARSALIASARWNGAAPANPRHPYLVAKSVKPQGIRQLGADLIIPMRDAFGAMQSQQIIAPDGSKKFLPGGRVGGCYFSIGKPDGLLCIAEGFATSASIHESTGHAVAVAFNAGNLEAVAVALRGKLPDARIVLCADDDYRTDGNPGIREATKAALAVGGFLAVPDFGAQRPDDATDFNDLQRHRGAEAVKRAVEGARSLGQSDQLAEASGTPIDQSGGTEETSDATLARLARLSALEYDRVRKQESKRLGVQQGTLDAEVRKRRKTEPKPDGQGSALDFPDPDPWEDPVDAPELMDELTKIFRRFVVLPEHADVVMALWVILTHAIDLLEIAPILAITAPEKGCGKTTALDLLTRLVRRPLPSSNITAAPLFRAVEKWTPTLLIDEFDSFLRDNDELRGVLNSGHTRQTACVLRCVGDDAEPRRFSTWGAKAISGIGELPATLADRSLIVRLRRALPHEAETTEKLRRSTRGEFDVLTRRIARWVQDYTDDIRSIVPEIPDELSNRAADNAEPLLALAQVIGGSWPERARAAVLDVLGAESDETASLSVLLLRDLAEVFKRRAVDRLTTKTILDDLNAMDDAPWPTIERGKEMTSRTLSRRLKPFGIQRTTFRDRLETFKGYERAPIDEQAVRYSPKTASEPRKHREHRKHESDATGPASVTGQPAAPSSSVTGDGPVTDVTGVTDVTEHSGPTEGVATDGNTSTPKRDDIGMDMERFE